MFHVVEITERGLHLSIRSGCLMIEGEDAPSRSLPVRELDAVVLAEPSIALTGHVIAELAAMRVPLVCCNRRYLPTALLYSAYAEGDEQKAGACLQNELSRTLAQRLWQRLIQAKIRGQSDNLIAYRQDDSMQSWAGRVRYGDSNELEAVAAAKYWRTLNLFPRRDRFAADANRFFNYVYAIIYSAFARYLCAATLDPHLGLHHHGRTNPFSLASDLMEPYRPWADEAVLALLRTVKGDAEFTGEIRRGLVHHLYELRLPCQGGRQRIFEAIQQTVFSYKRALELQQSSALLLPDRA